MAVDVDGSGQFLHRLGDGLSLLIGDAVVADGQVHVAQPVLAGELHVGLGAVDTDDGLDAPVAQ
jgi:hypothetical protein